MVSDQEFKLRCFICQELGHKASPCPKKSTTNRIATANIVTTTYFNVDWSLVLSVNGKAELDCSMLQDRGYSRRCTYKNLTRSWSPSYVLPLTINIVSLPY